MISMEFPAFREHLANSEPIMITSPPLTFEEYLSYDDGTDKHHELVNGALVELPPESPLNCHIARFLFLQFAQFIAFERICIKDAEIEVSGRSEW